MIECLNCAHLVDRDNEHLGAQGWLCEPSPNSVLSVTLVIAALTAQTEVEV